MKWRMPVLILLLATLIYTWAYVNRGPKITVGERYEYTIKTLDGESLTETNPAGGPTVVEFWATWCGPCIEHIPHINKLQAKHAEDGVRFIGISTDDDFDKMHMAIDQFKPAWINANDYQQTQSIAGTWGVFGLPETYLFSPTGELLWHGYPTDLDSPLKQAVAKYKTE